MIRRGAALLAAATALAAASTGQAAEGGPIRGGEHDGFTRIVLEIEPTTEWSLEAGEKAATLRFPGRALAFDTAQAFDRIPRSRVRAITTGRSGNATTVALALDCDCRVTASFIGARYLALDVADRDATLPPAPAAPAETAEARAVRETAAVATAEELLLRQIERAAGQGLVDLTPDAVAADASAQAAAAHPEPRPETEPVAARPVPPPAPVHGGLSVAPDSHSTAPASHSTAHDTPTAVEPEEPGEATLAAALAAHDQIDAITVYDRDKPRAAAAAPAVPDPCLPDDAFDVAAWATDLPMADQLPPLRRRLIGEFDTPDPAGIADLARFYIRYGFGAEAEALLLGFGAATPPEERALLIDLARTVEGRPLPGGGPLSLAIACPGAHGLWQALASGAPAFRDADQFAAVQDAFAHLPTDVRQLVGPGLAARLIDEGHLESARVIYETAIRPGEEPTASLDLIGARLAIADGKRDEAAATLVTLAAGEDPTALAALEQLVPLAIDMRLTLPDWLVTDLRAAAFQYRGSDRESDLRALLVAALAANGALPTAIAEARAAIADLPADAPRFRGLAVRSLANANPQALGAAIYARTAIEAQDLVATAAPRDPDRRVIADRLVALGLPSPALAMVDPDLAYGDRPARLTVARAEVGLARGAAARAALGPLGGPEATDIRARAFVLTGDYAEALATLSAHGLTAEAAAYAWPSGDWTLARDSATPDTARWAMAAYMVNRSGAAPAPPPADDPAALDAAAAFQQPLPALDRPTLAAARRLIATGPKVGDLIQGVLGEP